MNDRTTRVLTLVAIGLGVAFVAWAVFEKFIAEPAPGDSAYHAGNTLFEDGFYDRAAEEYRAALAEDPEHLFALRGLARSRHLAGSYDEALTLYHEAIARAEAEPVPEDEREAEGAQEALAASLANRGILLDTMGRHAEALADYERSLQLDQEIADGPNWMTRFLRNQADAPPTIADRAAYLRAELAKPEAERVLTNPEADATQRPYKR